MRAVAFVEVGWRGELRGDARRIELLFGWRLLAVRVAPRFRQFGRAIAD